MKTLLERAKKIVINPRHNSLSDTATKQQIELAIAWAQGDIRLGQASRILYNKNCSKGVGGKVLYTFACWLRAGIKRGILKVNKNKKL